MEGSYEWATVPVVSYQIMDSDEHWWHPKNPSDFDEASELMDALRKQHPGKEFTLFAELL